ncbi:MAG TPA: outer membrane beta-barrel protein [Pyrinomonadaceae bacterium]|nr:outer membrane beta-barrel protein [Pyrinomonadaceae bacterium]
MKRINKNLLIRLAFSTALLLCLALAASAQSPNSDEHPKFEFFAGYSALGETRSPVISFGPNAGVVGDYEGQGFETSIIRNFSKRFGIKGDFSAHFNNESASGPVTACTPVCTTVTQDFQLKTRVYNFLAGPEFKARNSTRFTPFVHALGGFAHTSATFTTPGPTHILFLRRNDSSFAMALGGGLDIRASQRVSFRASMDYNPVFVNDSTTGTRDFFRLSLGILFH